MAHQPRGFARVARLIPFVLALALAACGATGPFAPAPSVTNVVIGTIASASASAAISATATVATTAAATLSLVPVTATLAANPTKTPAAPPTPRPATATALPTATTPPSTTVPPVVRFMAVGDLMLGRSVGEKIQINGPGMVFSGVALAFKQADLIAANLECVISNQGQPQFKSFTFQAPATAIQALSDGGINVVSLANNHSMDYGLDGLADMVTRLRAGGISSVGAGTDAQTASAPVIIERNGVHVAFLAYVNVPVEGRTGFDTHTWAAGVEKPGVAWGDTDVIATDVAAARTLADVVVVLLHSGFEGRVDVNPVQQALAHAAVNAGAALVLGSHSHTLQPVEHYKGGIIAYSLGNFVFDGFLPPSNYTAIFSANLSPQGVDSYSWLPVVIENGLPRLATGAEAAMILSLLHEV